MAIKVKTSTEGAGSGTTWLKQPGKFHWLLLNADENPVNKDKQPLDGFKLQFLILAGEQKGKQFDLLLFNPDMSKSESAIEWAQRKQTAALIALGLIDHTQLGNEVSVDLGVAMNPPRQGFIDLDFEKEKDGTVKHDEKGQPRLGLVFANIYHIDDPACADPVIWQRDAAKIANLPPACRRDPASFPKHERKASGATASGATAGAGQAASAPKNMSFEGF